MKIKDLTRRRTCPTCGGSGSELYVEGSDLRGLREKAGISMAIIADRLGVSSQQLSRIERDQAEPDLEFVGSYLKAVAEGAPERKPGPGRPYCVTR